MRGRILLIADNFYPSKLPPESRINTLLAMSLVKRGWAVAVWGGLEATAPLQGEGIQVARQAKNWGILEIGKLIVWIAWYKPDRIGLMYFGSFYSNKAHINIVPLIAKWLRIPCYTLFTNGRIPHRAFYQDVIVRFWGLRQLAQPKVGLLGASSKLVFYCQKDRIRLLKPLAKKFSSTVVPPPSLLPQAPLGVRERRSNNFALGYFGLIYPGKGLEWILDALHLVRSSGMSATLLAVGADGAVTSEKDFAERCKAYRLQLATRARALGIEEFITWTGYKDDSQVSELLVHCDALCLPFDDGLSGRRSSFIECAKLGRPVITTLANGTDCFLRGPHSGILFVPPKDPERIAAEISRLISDPPFRDECGARLKKFALQAFDNEKFVDCFDS